MDRNALDGLDGRPGMIAQDYNLHFDGGKDLLDMIEVYYNV